MPFFIAIIIILLCFYIISEVVDKYFIKALDKIAEWLKLSDDIAGATLLAFGTSAPEISTALFAIFLTTDGGSSIGVGTIVGSAIFQILVVIGFAALIKTSYLNWKPIIRDSLIYALSILMLIVFVEDDKLTVIESGIMVTSYFLYLGFLFLWSRFIDTPEDQIKQKEAKQELENLQTEEDFANKHLVWKGFNIITWPIRRGLELIPDSQKYPKLTAVAFALCLFIIAFCSYWLVQAGVVLASFFGVDPSIVALTILAGGTSIPELISSAVVARQGRGDMAIANAIGSNTFDILMSLGLPVFLFTLTNENGLLENVGGVNISSSVILLFATLVMVISLLAAQKFKATKPFGVFLLILYFVYIWVAYNGMIENLDFF